MSKRLFLLLGVIVTSGLTACSTYSDPGKYSETSCDVLRALQASYESQSFLPTQPLLRGVNEIDSAQQSQDVLSGLNIGSQRFTPAERKDINSIRAAYKKNDC